MEKHAYAFIGWTGQEIERFEIPWDKELPSVESVCLKGPAVENDKNRYLEAFRGIAPGDVTEISADNGVLKVSVVPVTTRVGLSLVAGDTVIPLDEFVIHTRTADDKFAYREEGNVLYRLYTPDASGPRPAPCHRSHRKSPVGAGGPWRRRRKRPSRRLYCRGFRKA